MFSFLPASDDLLPSVFLGVLPLCLSPCFQCQRSSLLHLSLPLIPVYLAYAAKGAPASFRQKDWPMLFSTSPPSFRGASNQFASQVNKQSATSTSMTTRPNPTWFSTPCPPFLAWSLNFDPSVRGPCSNFTSPRLLLLLLDLESSTSTCIGVTTKSCGWLGWLSSAHALPLLLAYHTPSPHTLYASSASSASRNSSNRNRPHPSPLTLPSFLPSVPRCPRPPPRPFPFFPPPPPPSFWIHSSNPQLEAGRAGGDEGRRGRP